MDRFALLGLAAVLAHLPLISAQHTQAATPPSTTANRSAALHVLFQNYWEDSLKYQPEFASSIGDKRYNDQISDYSVKAINDWLTTEQEYLVKLAAIDPAALSDQDRTSRKLLMRDLAEDQESTEFKEWEMPVSQMGGIYSTYPQLVAQLSFESVKDYDDWIARLHKIPAAFDQVTAGMVKGVSDKRVLPKYLIEKTLDHVNELANQKPIDSPLALPLKKFPSTITPAEQTRIKAEMLDAITTQDLPAYKRFARFLEVSYLPSGRAELGISSLPDGERYYQFLIRRTTTTKLTPDQIHEIGLREVQKDEAEMLAIAKNLGFSDLKSFRASLKSNPKLKAGSREQLLDAYREYLGPMQARLPHLFGHLPRAPFEVVPVPEYLETTSSAAYYENGTPDGSRPGRLFIDTYNATDRDLYQVESIAYHEGLPGHHLQLSISQEQEGVPEFRKYEGNLAFIEGWALYAERLGKDIGLYKDPYSDYGRLQDDIWRAIRLVVDTGVHSQHWTRQQMVEFFHDHSSVDETDVQAEVDRYIAWPSQALAYKIGQLKILELRERAKKELGEKFDIRAYHDQVIDSGTLPLDVLDDRITAWIASQKSMAH